MCGIAGVLAPGRSAESLAAVAQAMAATLTHRGPDDGGTWVDADAGLALGHRRLSIVDLSPAGHQPMLSEHGRHALVLNGEIYGYRELRTELEAEGARFRGHSDTEVLLAAIERWGVPRALTRASGMFAFAAWERDTRTLWLARDRLGEKPLYVARIDGALAFASELKAFAAVPGFAPTLDRGALALFLRHCYVVGPRTIYAGVTRLPPGSWMRFDAGRGAALAPEELPAPQRYWDPVEVARSAAERRFAGSFEDGLEALDHELRRAVSAQMVSDVPLGAFLSGGIDSSTIVALMQAQSTRPVRTFTIGFVEPDYDEATHAAAVAHHLGTHHTELTVTPDEARAVIPRLPTLYDEPFGDPSAIPTFLVSQLAREHVTVALSGDGGDELFYGYTRYLRAARVHGALGAVPQPVIRLAAQVARWLPRRAWDAALLPARVLPSQRRPSRVNGDRIHRLAALLGGGARTELYRHFVSHWTDPESVVLGTHEPPTPLTAGAADALRSFDERMMLLDQLTYLPDDILVKVDRAAMAVSLETRAPLLDPAVVALAWSFPMAWKRRGGEGKWILKRLLDRYVPRALVERPKMGFGVPLDRWLRGPLRDWAEALLDADRLRREGVLRPEPIRALWAEHLSGQRNGQYLLWDVLVFQAWHEHARSTLALRAG